ncbi:MAG: hypothetical protein M1835_002928 [Candelina submexicana]|nr:MAG: hypothetical protein M1835_002928 [Candelina submexicana]
MLPQLLLTFVGLLFQCQAYPSHPSLYTPIELVRREGNQVPELTAIGDSYASGVGARPQPADDTNRCFRFPNACPVVLNGELKPVPSKFNNFVCNDNTFNQIKDKELLDRPEDDGKNGRHPAWGQAPEFVTITMGGNDIGILNLILTCILSFKLWGKDCQEVIQSGHDTINSQQFKDDLNDLIKAVIDKGRGSKAGDQFKVFIVGYVRFFNQDTTQCNDVSFKPRWNLLPAQNLTIERQTAMNDLALALNNALSDAVGCFKDKGVYWVDYDRDFDGHRFCDLAQKLFEKMPTYQATTKSGKDGAFKTDEDFINALGDAAKGDPEAESVLPDTVRMFHPSTRGHAQIQDIVLKALNDNGIPKSNTGVSAAKQFCQQGDKDKEYFQGSADSVKLSAHNTDDSNPSSQSTTASVNLKPFIDGCDGHDLANNPHNYKFSGTYNSPDSWSFGVQPTAQKPTEDSCDVSYRFLFDKFEVRGKNFPDSKLGANGDGLKGQIEGCGALTDWHFEWTPKDVMYQWFAYGNLPIGKRSCMERAVFSAEGSSAGHCHGAG